MLLQKNFRLITLGDSVTDCGRNRPVGEGFSGGLGTGYSAMLNAILTVEQPELRIELINMGIGGNTSLDLINRLQTDVIDLHPDLLTIMIGVNDVWRQFDNPFRQSGHILSDQYEANMRHIIEAVLPTCENICLISPFYLEGNRQDPMRSMLDRYNVILVKLAEEYGLPYIDVQTQLDELMAHVPTQILAPDRVHPHAPAAFCIAQTVYHTLCGAE